MATFNADGNRRLARATRRIEQTPYTRIKNPSPPRRAATAKYAMVTTAISAAVRSSSTLGKGAGTLQLVTYDASDVATYIDTGISVPIYSGATATIGTGRLIGLDFFDGRYHVVLDFC